MYFKLADRATGEPEVSNKKSIFHQEKDTTLRYHLLSNQYLPIDKKVGMVAYKIQLATNNQNNGNKFNGIKRIEF